VRSFVSAALLLLVAASPSAADVVHLKNGGRLVGRVEEDGDNVRIVMDGGTMTFARSRVERVERLETPAEEILRKKKELATGDAAGAVALAKAAAAAGLPADQGELLELAATWAPGDEQIRTALAGWRVFEKPLPPNPEAEAALAAAAGKGAEIYRTPHWRIAYATDLAVARRRGEMLEASWRKFRDLVEGAGLVVRPIADRMECIVFKDHAEWAKATGLPAADVASLVGLYMTDSRRILLYDTRTSPAALETERAVTDEIAALADARAAVEKQKTSLAQLETALAEALSATRRDEARVTQLRQFIDDTKKALADNEDAITTRSAELEKFKGTVAQHFAVENLSAATHEACHQVAFALGVSKPGQPLWLVEGLATLFEPQSRTTFVLEAANTGRLGDLRRGIASGDTGKLRRIVTDEVFASAEKRAMAYADSWSLTYFLARRRPAELAKFLAGGTSLANGPASADARIADFRKFFGADLDAIEREWREYVDRL
jgi:hypothetical protein